MDSPLIRNIGDASPSLAQDVFVAPGAVVVGDVTIGSGTSVWYGSVLRGDSEAITVGADCNVQDGCVLHSDPGFPLVLGDRVSLGHRAVVHGAQVEQDCLIGMGAIVMNGARIGTYSVVAAGAVVPGGTVVPPGSLVAGVPGKVRRPVRDEERAMIERTARSYRERGQRYRAGVHPSPG